jgi:hypothetical protein
MTAEMYMRDIYYWEGVIVNIARWWWFAVTFANMDVARVMALAYVNQLSKYVNPS